MAKKKFKNKNKNIDKKPVIICEFCGKRLGANDKFCSECGTKVIPVIVEEEAITLASSIAGDEIETIEEVVEDEVETSLDEELELESELEESLSERSIEETFEPEEKIELESEIEEALSAGSIEEAVEPLAIPTNVAEEVTVEEALENEMAISAQDEATIEDEIDHAKENELAVTEEAGAIFLTSAVDEMVIDNPPRKSSDSSEIDFTVKRDVQAYLAGSSGDDLEEKDAKEAVAEKVKYISEETTERKGSFLKYLLLLLLCAALGVGVWYVTKNIDTIKEAFQKENKEEVVADDNNTEEVEEEIVEEDPLYVEGREIGAIIQTKEEIAKTLEEVENLEYLEEKELIDNLAFAYSDFSMDMVRNTITKGENYVSSPLSLYSALGLLSNAASGETLEELNKALVMNNEDLNKSMYALMKRNKNFEGNDVMHFGNSVWLNGDMNLELNESYRDIVTSYYESDVYTESFDDTQNTIDKMNDWVSEHTDDAIRDLFSEDNVTPRTTFVLANALSFDDKWLLEFESSNNTEEAFYNMDGTTVKTEMLHSTEVGYWSDGQAIGISKDLANGGYVAFILPNEDVDIYDYIDSMSNDTFAKLQDYTVFSANETDTSVENHYTRLTIPKFKYDVTLDLKEAVEKMGVTSIFREDANLSKMLNANYDKLYVDNVIQKATVDLNEQGISAKAATMVGGLGAGGDGREVIYVYHDLVLDRPFIYAIVKDGMPSFVGVITTFEGEALSEEEIEAIGDGTSVIGVVTVNVDRLNIRTTPSTSGTSLGKAVSGFTYDVYEITSGEGYTWYRIGEGQWIADNGSWVSYNKN